MPLSLRSDRSIIAMERRESSANIRKVGEREILIVIIVVGVVAAVPELISEPFALQIWRPEAKQGVSGTLVGTQWQQILYCS